MYRSRAAQYLENNVFSLIELEMLLNNARKKKEYSTRIKLDCFQAQVEASRRPPVSARSKKKPVPQEPTPDEGKTSPADSLFWPHLRFYEQLESFCFRGEFVPLPHQFML